VAVLATLLKTVKEHQKQDVKVASIAGGILNIKENSASRALTLTTTMTVFTPFFASL
jgi:hypothetical protein